MKQPDKNVKVALTQAELQDAHYCVDVSIDNRFYGTTEGAVRSRLAASRQRLLDKLSKVPAPAKGRTVDVVLTSNQLKDLAYCTATCLDNSLYEYTNARTRQALLGKLSKVT
jgi:hypothetical protein